MVSQKGRRPVDASITTKRSAISRTVDENLRDVIGGHDPYARRFPPKGLLIPTKSIHMHDAPLYPGLSGNIPNLRCKSA
jgi:hypothetical protein